MVIFLGSASALTVLLGFGIILALSAGALVGIVRAFRVHWRNFRARRKT